MSIVYIMELAILLIGCLICFRGLKLYKFLQLIICGYIGWYIGVLIKNQFGHQELYILAFVLAIAGGVLGYKYYKAGMYLCAAAATFLVVFSYYWRGALAIAREGLQELMSVGQLLRLSLESLTSGNSIADALDSVTGLQTEAIMELMKEAADILQRGAVIAMVAGLVIGFLTLLLGDYVIMGVTAFFGSMTLITLLEMFVNLDNGMHGILTVAVAIVGLISQCIMKRKM